MSTWIKDPLEITVGTVADYKNLAKYHYIASPPSPPDQIYKIVGKKPNHDAWPDPIAIIMYSMPMINLRARTRATNGYFRKPKTEIGKLRIVNQEIRYISRIIVDPRFQKCGFATWLLKDTLERQTVPIVETSTPIDFTNKMFQKAGFKFYTSPAPDWYRRFTTALSRVSIRLQDLNCPPAIHFRIEHLNPRQKGFIEKEILLFITHFRHRKGMKNSLKRTAYFCAKIPYPEAYLIWHNPRVPSYDENPAKIAVTPTKTK